MSVYVDRNDVLLTDFSHFIRLLSTTKCSRIFTPSSSFFLSHSLLLPPHLPRNRKTDKGSSKIESKLGKKENLESTIFYHK